MALPSLETLKRWFMTSSTIFGTAIATPAFGMALTGHMSWPHASYAIAVGVISAIIPQRLSPAANGQQIVTTAEDDVRLLGAALSKSTDPKLATIGSYAPDVVSALDMAWAAYQTAEANLAVAKTKATEQVSVLQAKVSAPPVPKVPTAQELASAQASPASIARLAVLQNAQAAPGGVVQYTPA